VTVDRPNMPLSSTNSQKQKPMQKAQIGVLGENLVAAWLQGNGWEIIEKRWRCRWGEIDIIAGERFADRRSPEEIPANQLPDRPYQRIAFVEVKTRSHRNWDAGGLLSIHAQKQAKLLQTAEIFLSDRPDLNNCPCQFDVALVRYQRRSLLGNATSQTYPEPRITLGQPASIKNSMGEYQLTLHNYISGAFDAATF
jgi:putative endonuclease